VLVAAAVLLAFLGSALVGSLLTSIVTDLGPDPDAPGIPVSRGGPARTGEQPGPGPGSAPVVGWEVQTGAALSASPAVVDGVVYVGTHDRRLLALDADRGTERWSFATEGAVGGSPAVADGAVYVGDEAGVLYAVDADTGEERWRVDLGGSLYTAAPCCRRGLHLPDERRGGHGPAVDDGVVYAGGDGSASRSPLRLHALDAATGRERWRRSLAANGLFALDAATGEERWHARTPAPVYHSSPAVAGGAVYVGSKDGTVVALDAGTGRERWRAATGRRSTPRRRSWRDPVRRQHRRLRLRAGRRHGSPRDGASRPRRPRSSAAVADGWSTWSAATTSGRWTRGAGRSAGGSDRRDGDGSRRSSAARST
jgi:hypothetical protein